MGLRPIRSVLEGVSERRPGWGKNFSRAVIWKRWEALLGEKIAKNAWPERLSADMLVVRVSDSIWMHQLFLERTRILRLLNSHLSERARIKEIRFVIGDVSALRRSFSRIEETAFPGMEIPREYKERARLLVRGVRDPGLRARLEQLYLAYMARKSRLKQTGQARP